MSENPTRQAMIDAVKAHLLEMWVGRQHPDEQADLLALAQDRAEKLVGFRLWPLIEAYRAEGVAEGREQERRRTNHCLECGVHLGDDRDDDGLCLPCLEKCFGEAG
jgi:hypothetical protein